MEETKESSVKIDSDIKSAVSSYLKDYINNNSEKNVNIPDDIVGWFSVKIQTERNQWLEKIKVALEGIEVQRRNNLNSRSVIQQCLEQLTALLQGFDVGEDTLREITDNEPNVALPKCVEILIEICNSMMEEHFECLEVLGVEQNGFNLTTVLKQTIDELLSEAQNSTLEKENQRLYEEMNNLKNLLYKKQHDIELLQKQLNEINKVIQEQMLARSEVMVTEDVREQERKRVNSEKTEKAKSRNVDNQSKNSSTSASVLFEIVPSVTKLDTPDIRSNRISSEKSTATYMSSTKSQGQFTDRSIIEANRDKSYVQISEEKLRSLKIQAKKLETSLQDAISSMDKFNKKCYVGDKTISSVSSSITLSNVLAKNSKRGDYSARRLLQDLKVPSWHKMPFEIKGSHSNYDTGRKKVSNLRQSVSEGQGSRDNFRDEEKSQEIDQMPQKASRRNGPVTKCLRCQKLFRKIDNHKLACCYHPKPKERFEKYSSSGQLQRVMYVWKCCRHEAEHEGCCFGHHV